MRRSPALRLAALLLATALAAPLSAKIVGYMTPPPGVSAAALASLPAAQRQAWIGYLARSAAAMARDKAALAAERAGTAVPPPPPPEAKNTIDTMPLGKPAGWYAGPEARAIADNIVSFQTPSGGWGKNQDRTGPARVRGQGYVPHDGKGGQYLAQDGAGGWSFIGTIDNDATTSELIFLARAAGGQPVADADRYRAAFARGLDYLFAAEFPGGGWPQVWPLQGLYHDALTLNDDAMLHVLRFMEDVAAGQGDYRFVSEERRDKAEAAANRALALLLATQVPAGGTPTIWAQQYDPVTRRPVAARNFEPIALATGESASILRYLMAKPAPTPEVRRAVEAGAAWYAAHALSDVEWTAKGPEGRRLVAKPGASPLWARFYDPATGTPIFGDRDKSIHDDVNEISLERRNGYSWFNGTGTTIADAYAKWRAKTGG